MASQQTQSMRICARIVTKIMQRHSTGLTTSELFQLVRSSKPPQKFVPYAVVPTTYGKLGNARRAPPAPPHPDHPVQSLKWVLLLWNSANNPSFLKKTVLPMLAHKKMITVVQTTRPDAPNKLWVWKKIDQRSLPSRKPQLSQPIFGQEVGVGEDISHLNKRRQRARLLKVRRDVKLLRAREKRLRAERREDELRRRREAKMQRRQQKLAVQ